MIPQNPLKTFNRILNVTAVYTGTLPISVTRITFAQAIVLTPVN